jgi:hypothetical protein
MSDGQSRRHIPGSDKRNMVAGVIPILAVLALIFGVFISFLSQQDSGQWSSVSGLPADSLYGLDLLNSVEKTTPTLFPYSVIPGGAHNRHELLEALQREPVVAAHYVGFAAGQARIVRLTHDRFAYVSYRLGNRIYWTKKKVRLHEGETLLSDGASLARARCGNRVSDVALGPTSPQEPTEKVWNTPVVPLHVDTVSFPTRPQWPARAAAPLLLSLPNELPASDSTSRGGFPPSIPAFCCGGSSSTPTPARPGYPLPPPGYPPALPTAAPEPPSLCFLLLGLLIAAVFLLRQNR